MQLIIKDKVLQLDEKDVRMIEDGLYRNVQIRRVERSKKHCKDGDNLNELGMKIYQEELVIDHLRQQIAEALGGA
jgi:hypothetical protein